MWERDGSEGFCFINAEDEDSAIKQFIKEQNGPHPDGRLFKIIIVETNHTHKILLDMYGYEYKPTIDPYRFDRWSIHRPE